MREFTLTATERCVDIHVCRYKAACDDSVSKKTGAMGGILRHPSHAFPGNKSPGLFLGVCRGKASEGLNFSDHYGRAVIICGVPFPSSVDPRVKLKRQFLCEERSRSGDAKSFAQTADEWYNFVQEALRFFFRQAFHVTRDAGTFNKLRVPSIKPSAALFDMSMIGVQCCWRTIGVFVSSSGWLVAVV